MPVIRTKTALLLLLVAALTVPLASQDFASVQQSAAEELAKLNIPGASIAVVRGDQVIFSKSFGKANVETAEAVRPEMLFRLGSTTKMFTAAALVGLSLEGKIDLNAPIGKYVKGLAPKISKVTANQLLSHTAGIRDSVISYGPHDDTALGKEVRSWTDAWLFTAPGKVMSYSNPGYWLAGYLIEAITGKSYAEAMEARSFHPLGMTRTTLRPTMALTWPLAQGHEFVEGKLRIARPAADNASNWPAGSIFSNLQDLSRFVIAFMNDGRVDNKQVLDPKVIALMSSSRVPIPGGGESYGYGLMLREYRGFHLVQHNGSRIGYGSEIRMLPEQRVAVIVQTNRTGSTLPATTEKAIEVLVKLAANPAKVESPVLPVTTDDIGRVVGVYRNGDHRIEITTHDNRLFARHDQENEAEVTKRTAKNFSGEGRLAISVSDEGKVEYVHSGLRSYARVR